MGNGQGTGRAAAGSSAPLPAGRRLPAKFVDGSIMRHLLVMTGTSAIGLMAIFIGDLANIFFLSLLKDVESVAAVGYASSILFFATSIGIGLAIAATALVSPAIGARDLPTGAPAGDQHPSRRGHRERGAGAGAVAAGAAAAERHGRNRPNP